MTGTNVSVRYAQPSRSPACDRREARSPVLRAVPARVGGQVVLTLVGAIDVTTTDLVRDAAAQCLQQRPASLALDLCPLTFCDCAGMRTLRWVARQAACAHARFRLIGLSPQVRRILNLTGADDLLAATDPTHP